MKLLHASCQSCQSRFFAEPGRSFLGFQKMSCPACKAKVLYPLTRGYRATYWVITVLMVLAIFGALAQGGIGLPGFLGMAAVYALIRDWAIRRRVGSLPESVPAGQA